MKRFVFWLMVTFFSAIALSLAYSAEDYKVGSEDLIEVKVLEHPEFDTLGVVNPDGNMQVPVLGVVKVGGLTAKEINDKITELLTRDYLTNPVVTVSIKESRSKKLYIYGEVANPGAYAMKEDMTVLKAVTSAGGLNKFASPKVKIIRENKEKTKVFIANIERIIQGKEKDFIIEAGDIIVVKEKIL